MILKISGIGIVGAFFEAIGDFLDSEYALNNALRNEKVVNLACTKKERLTKLAIKKREKALKEVFSIVKKQIKNSENKIKNLCQLQRDINASIMESKSDKELKICLFLQKQISQVMNTELTDLDSIIQQEMKIFITTTQKILEA
jgi:L-lactate utilization protein LutC